MGMEYHIQTSPAMKRGRPDECPDRDRPLFHLLVAGVLHHAAHRRAHAGTGRGGARHGGQRADRSPSLAEGAWRDHPRGDHLRHRYVVIAYRLIPLDLFPTSL